MPIIFIGLPVIDESKDKIPQTDDLKDEKTKMEVSEESSKNEDENTKLDN